MARTLAKARLAMLLLLSMVKVVSGTHDLWRGTSQHVNTNRSGNLSMTDISDVLPCVIGSSDTPVTTVIVSWDRVPCDTQVHSLSLSGLT
jgi:hypothetical protein